MKPNKSKNVLILIPETDFDPTEVAVPWKILTAAGHQVVFATPEGWPGSADPRMITGEGLGIFKSMLIADLYSGNHFDLVQAQTFRLSEFHGNLKSKIISENNPRIQGWPVKILQRHFCARRFLFVFQI
jgi:putative intracellular protease/amidase